MRWYWVLSIVVVLVAAVFGLRLLRGGARTPTFSIAPATYQTITEEVSQSGTVASTSTANVMPSQSGTVESVGVSVGEKVTAGQVLATLNDNGNNESKVLQAKSQLDADEASLASALNPSSSSSQTIAALRLKIQVDEEKIAQDQANIAALHVTSPGTEEVLAVDVTPGETVAAGAPVVSYADPTVATVTVNVPQFDLSTVAVGQGATVETQLSGNIQATVTAVGGSSTGSAYGSSTFPVTVQLEHPPTGLNPGMAVTVYLAGNMATQKGVIAFPDQITVTAPAESTVETVPATVGELAAKGTVLATLSSGAAQEALQADQATLDSDQANLISDTTSSNSDTVASLEAKVASDEAALALAQQAVSELRITAPLAGTVTAVNISAGDQVSPSSSSATPAFTIVNPGALNLVLGVNQAQISQVEVGQSAIITSDGDAGALIPATVSTVSETGTNSSGVATFDVTLSIAHPDGLRPGMSATGTITVKTVSHVLAVPFEAVQGSGRAATVTVDRNGRFQVVPVVAGISNNIFTQIVSGLTAGEEVVTAQVSTSTSSTPGRGGFIFGGGARRQGGGGPAGGAGGGQGGFGGPGGGGAGN